MEKATYTDISSFLNKVFKHSVLKIYLTRFPMQAYTNDN